MSKTVLIIDDEALLRSIAARVLVQHGFTVLTAASGEEAEAIASTHPEPIDIMIIDVRLKDTQGPTLWDRLVPMQPASRAIFMTGMQPDQLSEVDGPHATIRRLSKPFTIETLLKAIDEALAS